MITLATCFQLLIRRSTTPVYFVSHRFATAVGPLNRKLMAAAKRQRVANTAHRSLMRVSPIRWLILTRRQPFGLTAGARVANQPLYEPVLPPLSNNVVAEAAKFAVDAERPAARRRRQRFRPNSLLDRVDRFDHVAPELRADRHFFRFAQGCDRSSLLRPVCPIPLQSAAHRPRLAI